MCVRAINARLTARWWKCICRVFMAGYQVCSRPAKTLTCTRALFVRLWREWESREGGSPGAEGFGGRGLGQGQWLPWTQQQGEEHLRAESLLRRGKSPSGRPAGESLIVSSNTPTPRRKEKKKSSPALSLESSPELQPQSEEADRNTPASPSAFLTSSTLFHTGKKASIRVCVWRGGGTGTFYCLPTNRNFLFSCSSQTDLEQSTGKCLRSSLSDTFLT